MASLSEHKTYRTRDGSRTGIRVEPSGFQSYPWKQKGCKAERDTAWTSAGHWRSYGDFPHDLDLIEEQPADLPFSYAACPTHPDGRKRAVTRDGREVVLLCDDAPGEWPIVGFEKRRDGDAWSHVWRRDGGAFDGPNAKPRPDDLFLPPPPKRKVWVNLYDQGRAYGSGCDWYESEATADGAFNRQGWKRLGNRAFLIEIEAELSP